MEIKKEQYEQIKESFPKQRKPAKISNLDVLNAVVYVVENGCKWRSLPKEYRDWHVIYGSDKPLGEKGRFGTGISAVAATGNYLNPSKCDKFGFHLHKGSSGWNGRFEKTGRNPSEGHGADGTPNFIWPPHLIGMG